MHHLELSSWLLAFKWTFDVVLTPRSFAFSAGLYAAARLAHFWHHFLKCLLDRIQQKRSLNFSSVFATPKQPPEVPPWTSFRTCKILPCGIKACRFSFRPSGPFNIFLSRMSEFHCAHNDFTFAEYFATFCQLGWRPFSFHRIITHNVRSWSWSFSHSSACQRSLTIVLLITEIFFSARLQCLPVFDDLVVRLDGTVPALRFLHWRCLCFTWPQLQHRSDSLFSLWSSSIVLIPSRSFGFLFSVSIISRSLSVLLEFSFATSNSRAQVSASVMVLDLDNKTLCWISALKLL